ncbi:MAG: phosphodiester glycosidase family protein [Bacteroidetes bacterium]|nr:phosphodiester glycosidase family protein [Bacteroidota bacterium]
MPDPPNMRSASTNCLLPLLICVIAATAQSADAQINVLVGAVADSNWTSETIAPGVVLRQNHFKSLLGLPQFVSVLEIDMEQDGLSSDVVRADSGLVRTSAIAEGTDAVAAVNGSYFEKDGTSSLFFQDNGRLVRADDNGVAKPHEGAALAVEPDGDAVVVRRPEPAWRPIAAFADLLVSGPLLVWDGEIVEGDAIAFNLTHHPRTAAGVTLDNKLILLTADGRNTESAGMTTTEVALMMQALGCWTAMNLDGGGSTTMWVRGRGVVNHPSDNKVFDAGGERPVANAIVVRARDD